MGDVEKSDSMPAWVKTGHLAMKCKTVCPSRRM